MKWRIEVGDLTADRRLLREVLAALGIELVEDGDSVHLVGDVFERLNTAGEVFDCASRLQRVATQVEQSDRQVPVRFNVKCIVEVLPDHTLLPHSFAALEGKLMSIVGNAAGLQVGTSSTLSENERLRLDRERQEEEFQILRRKATALVVSAFR